MSDRAQSHASDLLARNVDQFLGEALQLSVRRPDLLPMLYRVARHQRQARRTRRDWQGRGVSVPAFMIVSVTEACNLACAGCYARARSAPQSALDAARLETLISEADALGVSFILLAGGEPLLRPEVLDIAAKHPDVVFPLFTNGTLLDGPMVERLAGSRHIVPVLSVEGMRDQTDSRRGAGVHGRVMVAMERLVARGLFFGVSLTVTSENLLTVTDRAFVQAFVQRGCGLFFYVDYVPVQPASDSLALSAEQRRVEAQALDALRREHRALYVAFPGDESIYGGCLAAGRGFVHISPGGDVEPCPFSPYSDTSVRDRSLAEALRSDLLRAIREDDEHLSEEIGGCALFARRAWVASLAGTDAPPGG